MVLCCRLLKPIKCLGIVRFSASSQGQRKSQADFSVGDPISGGVSVPANGFRAIRRHRVTSILPCCEAVLRVRQAAFRSFLKPKSSFIETFGNAQAFLVECR